MPNYVFDQLDAITTPIYPKTDLYPLGSGADPEKYCDETDWNEVCRALKDVRGAFRGAQYVGMALNYADPAPAGGPESYIFRVVQAGVDHLMFKRGDGTILDLGGTPPSPVMSNTEVFADTDHVDVVPPMLYSTLKVFMPNVADGAEVTVNIINDTGSSFTLQASAPFTGRIYWEAY